MDVVDEHDQEEGTHCNQLQHAGTFLYLLGSLSKSREKLIVRSTVLIIFSRRKIGISSIKN